MKSLPSIALDPIRQGLVFFERFRNKAVPMLFFESLQVCKAIFPVDNCFCRAFVEYSLWKPICLGGFLRTLRRGLVFRRCDLCISLQRFVCSWFCRFRFLHVHCFVRLLRLPRRFLWVGSLCLWHLNQFLLTVKRYFYVENEMDAQNKKNIHVHVFFEYWTGKKRALVFSCVRFVVSI